MDPVARQYEDLPYPERDPEDERKRLILGSPSHPVEMDHCLWGGRRDWSRPLRVLVAGGGTGDGLIQLAAVMAGAGRVADITYLDLSQAARTVAEARARVRGLTGIRFETASLLDAPDLGRFDYIDCCGVIHHLPDPAAGLAALETALAPGGGIGLMVYAPLGRSGVYPLQQAFGALLDGLSPKDRVARAREILARLPPGHPFRTNPNLVDHEQGDAGFHDLLLHSRDRAYAIDEIAGMLTAAGLGDLRPALPALYDPAPITGDVPLRADPVARMALAERLRGDIKTHVLYAGRTDGTLPVPDPADMALIPHLRAPATALAQAVRRDGRVSVTLGSERRAVAVDRSAAAVLERIDGRTPLAGLAAALRLDPVAFAAIWRPVWRALEPLGLLQASGRMTRGRR
jgi:SAM-dependent methyltransferase